MKHIFLPFLLVSTLMFSGCSSDDEAVLSNKSANFWYQKMVHSIGSSNLDKADDYYSSLQSEHVQSPLVPQAMLMLSKAHANFDELILSQYYLDEYLKRFGDTKEREYVEFLKVKLAFLNYRHPLRNQDFLNETIKTIETFSSKYPHSLYEPLVSNMLLRLELGRDQLKGEIASLYTRIDKPKAATFYRTKERLTDINQSDIEKPDVFWLRALFE